MRKTLVVLIEALALAIGIVTVAFINPDTVEKMVAASQAANRPKQSAIGKVIVFVQAVGNVAMLAVHPQSAKPWPQQQSALTPKRGL